MINKKILIFGIGAIAKSLTYHIWDEIEIVAYVVSDDHYCKSEFLGRPVIKMSQIMEQSFDEIILATTFYDEVKTRLIQYGVNKNDIIDYYGDLLTKFDERLAMLRRVADCINDRNIQGEVAELGVYRGDFAKYINKAFPNRKLYLFDTFEGFDERDVVCDRNKKLSDSYQGQYKNIDIQMVLDKMMLPEQCIIKKGYFPETAEGLDERFAFVSIDVDLYLPIYEGLKYFYPRLEQGGCIFIHDYNNPKFKGVKQAVQEYCDESKIPYLPICDYGGSVVILK